MPKFSETQSEELHIYYSTVQEVRNLDILTGLKSQISTGLVSPRGSGGECVSLSLPASRGGFVFGK